MRYRFLLTVAVVTVLEPHAAPAQTQGDAGVTFSPRARPVHRGAARLLPGRRMDHVRVRSLPPARRLSAELPPAGGPRQLSRRADLLARRRLHLVQREPAHWVAQDRADLLAIRRLHGHQARRTEGQRAADRPRHRDPAREQRTGVLAGVAPASVHAARSVRWYLLALATEVLPRLRRAGCSYSDAVRLASRLRGVPRGADCGRTAPVHGLPKHEPGVWALVRGCARLSDRFEVLAPGGSAGEPCQHRCRCSILTVRRSSLEPVNVPLPAGVAITAPPGVLNRVEPRPRRVPATQPVSRHRLGLRHRRVPAGGAGGSRR